MCAYCHAAPDREPGWKERYYMAKFGAKNAEEIVARAADAAEKYFEGLVWVFRLVQIWGWGQRLGMVQE